MDGQFSEQPFKHQPAIEPPPAQPSIDGQGVYLSWRYLFIVIVLIALPLSLGTWWYIARANQLEQERIQREHDANLQKIIWDGELQSERRRQKYLDDLERGWNERQKTLLEAHRNAGVEFELSRIRQELQQIKQR